MSTLEVITSVGTLGAVVAALAIALFGETMASWFSKPQLVVEYDSRPPFCHKTLWSIPGSLPAACYYFRIKRANTGKRKARGVEVLAAGLSKEDEKGEYQSYARFLPMHLEWSHTRRIAESISPGMFKYCDLAHIIDPARRRQCAGEYFSITFDEICARDPAHETILSLDTEVKPFVSSHLLPVGSYRLVLLVGSENAKTIETEVSISFTGTWHVTETEMLDRGITIEMRR